MGEIIPFPVPPLRAFHIKPARGVQGVTGECGYVGLFTGIRIPARPYEGPERTPVGSLALVTDCILKPENRQGLPVISPPEAVAWAMSKPGPLRPWRQKAKRKLTDREKYDAALQAQPGSDWRWVCFEENGYFPDGAA